MSKPYKFQDFQILQTLDSTHQGNTKLYVVKSDNKIFVCKSINKSFFKDAKSVQHIKNQKQALLLFTSLQTHGINKLIDTFQDPSNLYMLLQLQQGLPLHKLLQMTGSLSSEFTRLIISQIGLIMKQFHKQGYVYRDIKASNFMINQKGKVKMIDLGKAKKINKEKTYTVCGTTHSMPPEVYKGEGYKYEFDYYSFGVLIYELLVGKAPFGYQNFSQQYLKIIQNGLTQTILEPIQCQTTKDLISKLMSPDPSQRLGSINGFNQILEHDYFNCPQFLDYKDILQEEGQIDFQDQNFKFYISEIQDFGLQLAKYNEIKENDPFYKFYG